MVEKLEVLKCTWKVLENQSTFVMYKYKYTRFFRNVLKYIPSTLQIVLEYRCT